MLRLENFHGGQIEPYMEALGALRIIVFRDYPYLYDGSLEYEHEYLKVYVDCPQSLVVLAFHGQAVVGATTCIPLAHESPEFQEPFLQAGHDVSKICYLGESILLAQYRRRGLGKQYFKHREKHARELGLQTAAFCAVDRPENHPLKPPGYRPMDGFWTTRGYVKHPELQATLHWKQVDEEEETAKKLTFWTKELE